MNFLSLLPELILFIGGLIILLFDVFLGKKIKDSSRPSLILALIFASTSLIILILNYDSQTLSNDMFFSNPFTAFARIFTSLLLIFVLLCSDDFIHSEKKISSEFMALMMIATCGAMLLISANDLLTFYLALELQSLALYILAAIKRESPKSSEAGIKYFILGSVSSAILLLGISLIYGFSGTTNFNGLFFLIDNNYVSIGMLLGFVLVLVAMLFKISAAPFHMWAPDVYEGAPTIVATFFVSAIKFMAMMVFLRIYINIINIWPNINQILILVALMSLLIGGLGAIKQNNIKRMFAYSGIGHIGFILAGLAAINIEAITASIIYITIYASLALGSFAFLLLLKSADVKDDIDQKNDQIYQISSLAGIGKTNPLIALMVAILMFSMAGIPPLAGFFAKFYILLAIIKSEFYILAVVAVLATVISAFYYLRIIKIMYFDEKQDQMTIIDLSRNSLIILVIMAMVNLFFFIFLSNFTNLVNNILSQ